MQNLKVRANFAHVKKQQEINLEVHVKSNGYLHSDLLDDFYIQEFVSQYDMQPNWMSEFEQVAPTNPGDVGG